MKIIKFTNNSRTVHYMAADKAQEARALFTALSTVKNAGVVKNAEQIIKSVRFGLLPEVLDMIDISNDVVPQLPQDMQEKVKEAKKIYSDRMDREHEKNAINFYFLNLVEASDVGDPAAHIGFKDLRFLNKLVDIIEAQEQANVAMSGGGSPRIVFTTIDAVDV